ncbi:MAG: hypothetical protein ACE37B_19550 [Ilumatobacter sp.]|uniref:hypothetical protein n=1 Tax=Ilumatobacter sp. TaxID=1967498 RepID=UPI00391C28CA
MADELHRGVPGPRTPRSGAAVRPPRRSRTALLTALLAASACGAADTATTPTEPTTTTATTGAATTPTTTATTTTPTASTTTTSTTSTTTTSTTTTAGAATTGRSAEVSPLVEVARGRLDSLVVADPDRTRSPYERDDYDGEGWADDDGDCVNTRHEVLAATSLDAPIFDGCRVRSGRWIDPYSSETITDAALATIDHLVPLAEAHRAGAWRWDTASKVSFANDQTPGVLVVASGDSNQAKADLTPDRWLPPDPVAHCQYAIDWISTKSRYALTVTATEAAALDRALGTCATTSVVRPPVDAPTPSVVITTPTTTTTLPIAPTAGPGVIALLSCDERAEEVAIANTGGETVSLSGYVLHDEGRNHEVSLGQFGSLDPAQRLVIVTGPDAVAGDGRVVWKLQNVWNNDGDVAHLIAPDATLTTLAC